MDCSVKPSELSLSTSEMAHPEHPFIKKVAAQHDAVGARTGDGIQSGSEDSTMICSHASVSSHTPLSPPTPPCLSTHRTMPSPDNGSTPGASYNPARKASLRCSRGLVGHLRNLSLQQHASALCSQGYNRLSDLLHMSADQLEQALGAESAAHSHRLLYSSANILARQQARMQAQEAVWGPVSILVVFTIMLAMLCIVAASVAVVAVPGLRKKLTVIVAVVASEVWYYQQKKTRRDAPSGPQREISSITPTAVPQVVTASHSLSPPTDPPPPVSSVPPTTTGGAFPDVHHHRSVPAAGLQNEAAPPRPKRLRKGAFTRLSQKIRKSVSEDSSASAAAAQPVAESIADRYISAASHCLDGDDSGSAKTGKIVIGRLFARNRRKPQTSARPDAKLRSRAFCERNPLQLDVPLSGAPGEAMCTMCTDAVLDEFTHEVVDEERRGGGSPRVAVLPPVQRGALSGCSAASACRVVLGSREIEPAASVEGTAPEMAQ